MHAQLPPEARPTSPSPGESPTWRARGKRTFPGSCLTIVITAVVAVGAGLAPMRTAGSVTAPTAPATATAPAAHAHVGALGPAVASDLITTDGRAAYVPLTPCRLGDTRTPATAPHVVDEHTLRISLVDRCGIPPATSAVAISIAVTDTSASGYADVTAAGQRGATSTVNWVAGETRSAATVVAASTDDSLAIEVYVSTGVASVAVVVDVTGRWEPTAGAVAAGRLVTLPAHRVLDTRATEQRLSAGHSLIVDRRALGVPADALAVTGNMTSTAGSGAGYLTAYPAGGAAPLASNVNTDAAGQDRASGVIVPLAAAGLAVYAGGADADVVFDVTGYVSGPSEPATSAGLLVLTDRKRILDTRSTSEPTTTLATATVTGLQGITVGGIIGTISVTAGSAAGYASVQAVGAPADGATSSVNWQGPSASARNGAVASMIVQHVGASGQLQISASSPTALIVDITAYLLAEPGGSIPAAPLVPVDPLPATQPVVTTPTTAPAAGRDIATGTITDLTGDGKPTGDPIDLLRQTFTANELEAGGGVNIVYSAPPGGAQLMVPYNAKAFPVCSPQPMCILINEPYWIDPGRDPVNSNRVMISHEFGHVLAMRYQTYVSSADYRTWITAYNKVHEECIADSIATIVLARGGFQPNETTDYIIHYSCDDWWVQQYGADHLAEMQAMSIDMANDLLTWAEQWGANH